MSDLLSRQEAIQYLGLDENVFDNYFKTASEFPSLERPGNRGRFLFEREKLQEWKRSHEWRTVLLQRDDYALCLDFALAQHFRGYVQSDWGTTRQREFGQRITNWVKGQLGEVAVKKFFNNKIGVDVELDFDIYSEIVPQDIIGVAEKQTMRKPKIGVGIKSSKPKNAYLVLSENEIKLADRRSDVYIFCRPDIPDDHLLRLTKKLVVEIVQNKPHFSKYKDQIPGFTDIPCEVVGWCYFTDLLEVQSIPNQEFDGIRYVIKSGLLRRTREDWQELIEQL